MRAIFSFINIIGIALAADDILAGTVTTPPSSVKASTTKYPSSQTGDDVLRITLQRQTNTNAAVTTRTPKPTSVAANMTQEGSGENSLFKLMLTVPPDDSYYNARMNFGNGNEDLVELRVDLIQPDIWVMNGEQFLDCTYLNEWWSSEEPILATDTTESIPPAITTMKEYTATNCGKAGLYSPSPLSEQPNPTNPANIQNGDPVVLPYMNLIDASGVWNTDNISFNLTTGASVQLTDVSFVNVNDTNMFAGGLGLSGNPQGSGFLYTLKDMGIIESPGYSLWFSSNATLEESLGQLIPGAVSTKYFTGKFVSYKMLKQIGSRFTGENQGANDALINLSLPIVLVDDVKVENPNTGKSISIKSNSAGFPVLLDSRLYYSAVPLDVIVNLAIQTNAYYNDDVDRWLVACDVITNSSATLNFLFGGLTVKIPLSEFITEAHYKGQKLTFAGGEAACFLAVSPTSSNGYNSLGLPFIRHIYLAIDNEGQTIAMANTNPFLNIDRDEMMQNVTEGNNKKFSIGQSSSIQGNKEDEQSSASVGESIGYIKSGSIPFATPMRNQSTDVILTFSSINTALTAPPNLEIPARLSGAVLINGSIYVTRTGGPVITTFIPGRASAATEMVSSKKNIAGRIDSPFAFITGYLHDIYLLSGMGLAIIWIMVM
ncbi:Aspartic proteinase yapsin-7 [Spathaspora sp. JA1]|nr:Aspartic proteinase yapsin-7 [Spathaspora sp. JA1]